MLLEIKYIDDKICYELLPTDNNVEPTVEGLHTIQRQLYFYCHKEQEKMAFS